MAPSRLNTVHYGPLIAFTLLFLFNVAIAQEGPVSKQPLFDIQGLSVSQIEDELQKCPFVEKLNHDKASIPQASTLASQVFAVLFPGSPAVNALLATLYISGPPNFILALCPPSIDPASLSVMVAFAVGGLLGDTLFHLLPEIFLGEDSPTHVRFVMVEPNRNLLLGVAILVGFVTFVAMDKGLRIATGGGHDHGHKHELVSASEDEKATSSGIASKESGELKKRSKKQPENGSTSGSTRSDSAKEDAALTSAKLRGMLNIIADFTHNITDGLAISSSFYASPTIGATTTVAIFFHEVPHEVGDFALLIQSGFSKYTAMGAQFGTALGALLGTCIGISVQEFGGGDAGASAQGLFGTSLEPGDLLLPFTAGTFLYVGTVSVIPDLLELGPNGTKAELFKTAQQFLAMATGAGIMLYISWS